MNIKKIYERFGLIENVHFSVVENECILIPVITTEEQVIDHPAIPAVMNGETIIEPAVQAWQEVIQVDVEHFPVAPTEEQKLELHKQICIEESDIVMLINNYLEANKEFVTDEDSMNIVDNRIHSWNFVNVTQPSIDILYSLIDSVAKSERNAAKIKQIEQLESLITARKLREAVLSGDNSFIQNIENQISAIRATLE